MRTFGAKPDDRSGGGETGRLGSSIVEDFEIFYRREYVGVVALAYALSGNRHAAEDLAQDGFLAAHRRWDEISRYDQPRISPRDVL